MVIEKRLTITDVAKTIGVTPRTIMRWEKAGKIQKCRRDWRGWRFYHEEDVEGIRKFFESAYEVNGEVKTLVETSKVLTIIALTFSASMLSYILCGEVNADTNFTTDNAVPVQAVQETPQTVEIRLDALPAVAVPSTLMTEDVKYTLGANDVVEITVRRHPEFSGQYAINGEGKIEYKFVGDVLVDGLTKAELTERLIDILSEYIIEPEVDVTILAYLSKVFYVVGEVTRPGKFYMRGNTVSVREALIQAGLPAQTAEIKSCRLITPNESGKKNMKNFNAMKLLYEGDLSENLDMNPGDVIYVPATVMAKIIRVISPVTTLTGQAAGAAMTGAAFIP